MRSSSSSTATCTPIRSCRAGAPDVRRGAAHLSAPGFDVTPGVGGTGVVGVLPNGEGPTVMLRGDMDALPVAEATGLDYASTVTATDLDGTVVPVMHACGHDMHVAWLAGATACSPPRATHGAGPCSRSSSRPRRRRRAHRR